MNKNLFMVLVVINVLKKKCSYLMDFFQKGRGGFQSNPKVLGHFLCTKNFGTGFGKKGGGLTKSISFGTLFAQILGEL